MKAKPFNTVKCNSCTCEITEPKTAYQIRQKLKKLGWQRVADRSGEFLRFVDRCGKCSSEAQNEAAACPVQRSFTKDMSLALMKSPWAIQ